MGVIRWLVRVDPETWDRAHALVERRGEDLIDRAEAVEAMRLFGREATEEKLEFLEDEDDDEEFARNALRGLFEELVTEEYWYLDKSLNGLETVAGALPGGDVLLDIIDFGGLDVTLPESCAAEDSGLFGCCTAAGLAPCAQFLEAHTAEAVERGLARAKRELDAGLSGPHAKLDAAIATMQEEYHRTYWDTLREAVLSTVAKGHHLGLGLA